MGLNIKCSNWIRFYDFWILTGSKWLNMYCYSIRRWSKVSYIVVQSFVSILLLPSGRIPLFTCITIQPSATIRAALFRCELELWEVSLVTRGHHNSSFFLKSIIELFSGWFFECNTSVNIKRSYQENFKLKKKLKTEIFIRREIKNRRTELKKNENSLVRESVGSN